MKRLFILLSMLFCTFAFADTIIINWGVDNQPYTTTTCEIGGDVILPSVSKRGHIFRGWTPQYFDRGVFENWYLVPETETTYHRDSYNNRTPKQGDNIIVNNATDYVVTDFLKDQDNIVIRKTPNEAFTIDVTVGKTTTRYYYTQITSWFKITDDISIRYVPGAPGNWYVKSDNQYYVNNVAKTGATMILCTNYADGTLVYVSIKMNDTQLVSLSGTWRFVYDGVWEVDGKNGWKPDYQIITE